MRDIDDSDDEETRSAEDDERSANLFAAPHSNSFRKQPDGFRFGQFLLGFFVTALLVYALGGLVSAFAEFALLAIGLVQVVVVWPLYSFNRGPEKRSFRHGVTTCAVIVLLLNAACYALLATIKFH